MIKAPMTQIEQELTMEFFEDQDTRFEQFIVTIANKPFYMLIKHQDPGVSI